MWRLYKTGYWIDNWIYWITHSYTQLQRIHSYSSLQFTIHVPSLLTGVFTGCLSSNTAGSVHLQNSLATLQLFSEDCCFTVDS
jgi:hypothetical protein